MATHLSKHDLSKHDLSRPGLSSAQNRFELAYLLPSPHGDEPRYRRYAKRKWWLFRWEHWHEPGRLYSEREVRAVLEADNDNGSE